MVVVVVCVSTPHEKYENLRKFEICSILPTKCMRNGFSHQYIVRIVREKTKNNKRNVKEMNIFYLSRDPKEIAKQLCDKHIVKMPLESAQMLSTSWWAKTKYNDETKFVLKQIYRPVHIGHPSTVWTMQTEANYLWHYDLFVAMLDEYSRRYNKVHGSSKLLELLKESPVEGGEFYPPPQCMPDEYKTEDTILAYRNYYINEKARFARYTNGTAPEWLEEYL